MRTEVAAQTRGELERRCAMGAGVAGAISLRLPETTCNMQPLMLPALKPAWRIVLFAMLGCLIVFVPTLGQPQQDRWFWAGAGAFVCAAMEFAVQLGAPLRCRDHALLPCLAAILAGVSLDFLRVSPQALLDFCDARAAASGFGWHTLSEHGRWFPATTLAMFAAIAWPRLRAWPARSAAAIGTATRAVIIVSSEFAAMCFAMGAAMAITHAFATQVRASWEAAALVCAMLVGMSAFFAIRRALRVARDWVLQGERFETR